MQAKRINVNENNLGAGGQVSVELLVPDEPREEINFHNIWIGANVEPQDAGANAQGTWVLWIRRDGQADFIYTDVNLRLEQQNQKIVACGVYGCSNESTWTLPPTTIKTSRNLGPGDRLVLSVIVTGLTAGLASIRCMLCAHTVRK